MKYSEVWLDKCRLCAAKKKDNYRREEGKGHRCWLGDIIEYRTNHLAEKMIWWKVVGRTTTLGGWYFGLVWTCWSAIFSIHPFRQVANILFILFFKSSWCKIASAARNWIYSVAQTEATTFAFSSVFTLLLWSWPGHHFPISLCPLRRKLVQSYYHTQGSKLFDINVHREVSND